MSHFGCYEGKEFLDLDIPPRTWLVENIMRENDSVILVGNEKSGKSLCIFQLICSLTTCHPFFDHFNVPKPCRVVYIQLEGELGDSQDRMKRMIKALDINPDLFHINFFPPLELQERAKMLQLADTIENQVNPEKKGAIIRPDVVIIDPIYFAYIGSLNDDEVVRKFIGNIRILKDRLKCAVILVHHTHKQKFDYAGGKVDEGDEAIFGSKIFKAWADHILLFTFDSRTNLRILACNTQRSGDIIKECVLKLVEPDPLYFERTEKGENREDLVINLLRQEDNKNGLTVKEISKMVEVCEKTVYTSLKKPLTNGIVIKSTTRPVIYIYNRKGNEIL